MRRAPTVALALLAGCSAPAPAPAPPAPPPEPPSPIQTAAITPATEAAVPLPPDTTVAPPAAELPARLSPAQVEKTFTHHRRFFNDAYRERLGANPRLAGTMVVSFMVNPDGTTRDARRVQSSLNDPPLERAVLEAIDRMAFPPAAGPTPVERYPLQFNPASPR
jgi:protein TonB